jgi:hypothetical protein
VSNPGCVWMTGPLAPFAGGLWESVIGRGYTALDSSPIGARTLTNSLRLLGGGRRPARKGIGEEPCQDRYQERAYSHYERSYSHFDSESRPPRFVNRHRLKH